MIQNQAGAGLAPLGKFKVACQPTIKGISYPKPQKKFIHTPLWGSAPLATRLSILSCLLTV